MSKNLILICLIILQNCKTINTELKYSVSDDIRTALEAGSCSHKTVIPKIIGIADPMGKILNRKIYDFLVKIEEEYRPIKHIKEHLEECLSHKYSLLWSAHYVKSRHDRQVLSFKFSTRFYLEGYIHPVYQKHGLTFDVNTGTTLKLVDIVMRDRQKEFIIVFQAYFSKKKIFPDETGRIYKFHDLNKFYLTNEKIVIFVNGHDLVPNADGSESVSIPLKELQGVLVPKYEL